MDQLVLVYPSYIILKYVLEAIDSLGLTLLAILFIQNKNHKSLHICSFSSQCEDVFRFRHPQINGRQKKSVSSQLLRIQLYRQYLDLDFYYFKFFISPTFQDFLGSGILIGPKVAEKGISNSNKFNKEICPSWYSHMVHAKPLVS